MLVVLGSGAGVALGWVLALREQVCHIWRWAVAM